MQPVQFGTFCLILTTPTGWASSTFSLSRPFKYRSYDQWPEWFQQDIPLGANLQMWSQMFTVSLSLHELTQCHKHSSSSWLHASCSTHGIICNGSGPCWAQPGPPGPYNCPTPPLTHGTLWDGPGPCWAHPAPPSTHPWDPMRWTWSMLSPAWSTRAL